MTAPVHLPGFTYSGLLGQGGFADVFLYTQHLPQRPVAVKVLRQPVTDPQTRAQFETEANLMAALSTHPAIVTIHHAWIAEGGRPCLVMEYCSRPTLAAASQQGPLGVPEVLQTMIRLAGAVETAHRSGILHRDIKPANVLTTDWGWPALTDFGLSSFTDADYSQNGISVPWAAPEMIAGHGYDARADVYGLAATAYTVLAGRAPFDDPHAPDLAALVVRVLQMPPPPIGRPDVPEALERLILASLAKDPLDRPQTASEFARGLQRVEQDLHLPMTHLDVPVLPRPAPLPEPEGDRTRMAGSEPDAGQSQASPEVERTVLGISRPVVPDQAAHQADLTEQTQLADRTRLADSASPLDQTRLADRTRAADHTLLSPRGGAETPDEATRLASRHGAVQPAVDDTVLVSRSDSSAPEHSADVPGSAGRQAYSPHAEGVAAIRYSARTVSVDAVVRRAPAVPEQEHHPASPPKKRRAGRGGLIAITIVVSLLVLGAASAAVLLLWGG